MAQEPSGVPQVLDLLQISPPVGESGAMAETGLDRPIPVIGAPRSGKSLVTNVVFSADEFCVLGEALLTWECDLAPMIDQRSQRAASSASFRRAMS